MDRLNELSGDAALPAAVSRFPSGRSNQRELSPDLQRLLRCSTAAARSRIPLSHAERLKVLPLSLQTPREGEELLVVLAEATLLPAALAELRFLAGASITVEAAGSAELLRQAIPAAYRSDVMPLRDAAELATKESASAAAARDSNGAAEIRPDAPVPRLLEAVLIRGYYLGASDIHIEPQRSAVRLRFRVDGRLREETEVCFGLESLANLSRHVKVLCQLDLTDRRRPQDGSFTATLREGKLRVRVSFLPQTGNERIVMRLFHDRTAEPRGSESPRRFSELGLDREQERVLLAHLGLSGGALIFSGPTGSGKTTLLYSCLEYLNEEWRSVVSIEDPVERQLPGINQTQVSPLLGFRDFLPALLRQDPDVVMVGEMRDGETAETALTAGITGHLVLSTVHAGSCLEILPRLQYLGISGLLLGTSLRLLSAQRLLPKNCTECLENAGVSASLRSLFHLPSGVRLLSSAGCESCGGTGISGRCGVFEFLPISPAIQELLLRCVSPELAGRLLADVKQQAKEEGFQPLAFRIRDALIGGAVSPASACRALGMEPRLFDRSGRG